MNSSRKVSLFAISFYLLFTALGATVMAALLYGARWQLFVGEGEAEWANAIVTGIAAVGAVATTILLWMYQQKVRSRQIQSIGITMFVNVYNRLVELSAFTDYKKWHAFYVEVYAKEPAASPEECWVLHKAGADRYLTALIAEVPHTVNNFAVLRDNLVDFNPDKMDAVSMLFALVGGIQTQLTSFQDYWRCLDDAAGPVALDENWKRLLSQAIGACAFHLKRIDGKSRSPDLAEVYGGFYAAQKRLHS